MNINNIEKINDIYSELEEKYLWTTYHQNFMLIEIYLRLSEVERANTLYFTGSAPQKRHGKMMRFTLKLTILPWYKKQYNFL